MEEDSFQTDAVNEFPILPYQKIKRLSSVRKAAPEISGAVWFR